MNARQRVIRHILAVVTRPLEPAEVATALTHLHGIQTHPSAAARALRKLARRGLVEVIPDGEAVTLRDRRKHKMGLQVETTPVFLYANSRAR